MTLPLPPPQYDRQYMSNLLTQIQPGLVTGLLSADASVAITRLPNGSWNFKVVPGSGAGVTAVTATTPIVSSGGTTPNISHATSGVTAGSYTNASITVNATGHVTSASNGSGGAQDDYLAWAGL